MQASTKLKNITVGADPELFAFNNKYKQFVSVHKCFPGTKEKPFPVKNGALQLDGVAAELNITPAGNRYDFASNLKSVMRQAEEYLPDNCILQSIPATGFNGAYFDQLPETVKELGCCPDFNAYQQGRPNPIPEVKGPVRAAGGHVHLGWSKLDISEEEEKELKISLVLQLDYILGLSSLEWDASTLRRKFYGKAGAYRPKPYGLEYRVLSNAWLRDEESMMKVFDLAVKAVDMFNDGNFVFATVEQEEVQRIINTGDRKAAKEVLRAIL